MIRKIAARALGAFLLAAPAAVAAPAQPDLVVELVPGPMDAKAGKGWLDVTLAWRNADVAAGAPLLALPVVIANTDTVANTLTGLTATDAAGPVALVAKDDPVAIAYARHWTAGRAVSGVRMKVLPTPLSPPPSVRRL